MFCYFNSNVLFLLYNFSNELLMSCCVSSVITFFLTQLDTTEFEHIKVRHD